MHLSAALAIAFGMFLQLVQPRKTLLPTMMAGLHINVPSIGHNHRLTTPSLREL